MRFVRTAGIGAGLLLSLVVAGTTLAVDPPTPEPTVAVDPPTPGTPPVDHPKDTNTEKYKEPKGPKVQPMYLFGHTEYDIRINKRYNGYLQTNMNRGCLGPCTLALAESENWQNKLSFTVGFEKGPINAKVGFDTSAGGSRTFSYSFYVPSGVRRIVAFEDWYDTFLLSGYKRDCTIINTCDPWVAGSGWAGRWMYRIFKAVTV